jgi:hypothetical protein
LAIKRIADNKKFIIKRNDFNFAKLRLFKDKNQEINKAIDEKFINKIDPIHTVTI